MAKSSTIIIGAIIILALGGGGFFIGWMFGNDWQFSDEPSQISPTIDGVIEKNEWLRSSYYNIPFYLDVDNTIDPVRCKCIF